MKTCTICGNEISATAGRCPFCEHTQHAATRAAPAKQRQAVTVMLKEGRPTVDDALNILERELAYCRRQGVKVVRLVHGYGSSGLGGDIKKVVHLRLAAYRKQKIIKAYLPGEDYSELTESGRSFRRAHPALEPSFRTDRKNPGITFVVL